MKNLAGLMKQAQQMQSKMQEMQAKLETTEVTGEAGAGLVKVTLNGRNELRAISIDPKLIDPSSKDGARPSHNDRRNPFTTRSRECTALM